MAKKQVSLRIDEEIWEQMESIREKAGMDRTEYIVSCLQDNPVVVLEEGAAIAGRLTELIILLQQEEAENGRQIERGMEEICVLLHSLTKKLAEGA